MYLAKASLLLLVILLGSSTIGLAYDHVVCDQPKVTGPCEAYILSYFYNSATGHCEQFGYGGCMGNDNRFATIKACQTACHK